MLSCCGAHLMASFEMLEPCALAYSAACLHAAFTSSGAGCHSGGPWRQRILSKGRIHTVPAQCCTLMGCMQRFGDAFIELMLLLQYETPVKKGGGRQSLKPQIKDLALAGAAEERCAQGNACSVRSPC